MNNNDLDYPTSDGVVFVCNPHDVVVEWRDIPGYSKYQACNLGLVRNKTKQGTSKLYPIKTSKGTYLRVSAVSDDRQHRTKEVHHLICLAYHPYPTDGRKYEVNHKDGNKHNNLPTNLEWMTRSENINHSYEIGLRGDNIFFDVTDVNTGEVRRFSTESSAARHFGLTITLFKTVVLKHQTDPYLGRYTFKKDFSKSTNQNKARIKDILAYDAVNRKMVIASDIAHMSWLTGVKQHTIWRQVTAKTPVDALISGYIFRLLSDNKRAIPKYTKKEASESRVAYETKKEPVASRLGVTVKDYIKDTVTYYPTREEASKITGVGFGTIHYILRNQKHPRIFRGYAFKYSDDKQPWREYEDEVIEVSLDVKKSEYPMIRVTDLHLDTTKLYPTLTQFAKEVLGRSATGNMGQLINANPNLVYLDRYKFEKVYL